MLYPQRHLRYFSEIPTSYHQPINVSPLLGLPYGIHIRRMDHNPPRGPSAGWWVQTTANAAGTNGLACLPKYGGARDNELLITHPMTDHHCLTFAIARRSALTWGPSRSSDAYVLPKLLNYETGDKPIAVWSQSISGVSVVNPVVAFYDIHGRKVLQKIKRNLAYYFLAALSC
jgi:hypothetical protein